MTFEITVPKEKEGTYFYVPFSVPDGIIKLTVSYSYRRDTKGLLGDLHPTNTIDIGIADEKGRFLGWSGSAHSSISVGEFSSSSGYPLQKINGGEWQIIVGAYHVVPEGVTVRYDIEFEEKHEKLLFGDLHIHSLASDGSLSAFQIADKAKSMGLDFIALANHNNFAENFNLPAVDGLSFIPAVEWTHYNGHMNFFGVKNPFENSFIANNITEMKNLIDHARSLGAVISVNHPKCRFCPYKWNDENCFDMVEVWNGPMRKTNTRGIEWWTELLRKGRQLPIVGGSDFHRPRSLARLGNPVTAVHSLSSDGADILAAISSGKSFVTSGVNGVRLEMEYGNIRLGEKTDFDGSIPLTVKADKLSGDSLVLVTQQGEQSLKKHAFGNISFNIPLKRTDFVYLKSVKRIGNFDLVTAITNPIYFD